jgi:hypothetical protein
VILPEYNIKTTYIQQFVVDIHTAVSDEFMADGAAFVANNCQVSYTRDFLMKKWLFHFRAFLAAKEKEDTQRREDTDQEVIESPSSWWEMLKRDHAPVWFLRRYPVQYDTRTIVTRTVFINSKKVNVCPHLPMKWPKESQYMCISYLAGEQND